MNPGLCFGLLLLALWLSPAAWAQDEGDATVQQPATATDKIVDRFMDLDIDASAGVSFQEYLFMVEERAESRFTAMDANEDGEVSEAEYRAFWKARKAQWYRIKR